ncbi:hypothetical protein D9619_013368 [Psilocybe cf. subviscida]|uniref:DUF6534 domain-containing protein n=1 Tax=Psilocybe cf. subviscida TaxID=2480587 RepID=A0A8H5BRG6_9AGAR|nr:hypothetical protein D9619_013368 [Psilocybe cf. subviscida]
MSDLPLHIEDVTGPMLLGSLLHWGLYSILLTQIYTYYMAFPRDSRIIVVLVYTTLVIGTVFAIISTSTAWRVFATGFGDPATLYISWFNIPLVGGAGAFIAEIFYAHRIRLLSRSYIIPVVITMLALLQMSAALVSAILLKKVGMFSNRTYTIAAWIWNSAAASCNIMIACCMVYYLFRIRAGSQKSVSTQILRQRPLTFLIEAGVVTAIFATLHLILSMLPSPIAYFLVTSEITACIYANSMLVLLNGRIRFSHAEDEENPDTSLARGGVLAPFDVQRPTAVSWSVAKESSEGERNNDIATPNGRPEWQDARTRGAVGEAVYNYGLQNSHLGPEPQIPVDNHGGEVVTQANNSVSLPEDQSSGSMSSNTPPTYTSM